MLRRKLLIILGPLVLILTLTSAAAIWLLEGVLRDLRRVDTQAWEVVERAKTDGTAAKLDEVFREREALAGRFRTLVMGIGLAFLVVINLSVAGLLRVSAMVLRPVGKLVEASRQLGKERFDYRVETGGGDEFDELAKAYNRLADELQTNEKRKVEMLGQIALAMNHELNNAMAIIELQLRPLSRQASGNKRMENCLAQIRENLDRMARTVERLKRVRRIVLTDYVSGVKMLDLEESVREHADSPAPGNADVSVTIGPVVGAAAVKAAAGAS